MSGKGVRCKRIRAKVISIKPEYAKLIYEGKKKWEFRKVAPAPYQSFYIYESAPVSAITGFVYFGVEITGSAPVVWEIATTNKAYPFNKNYPGIKYEDYLEYALSGWVTAMRIVDYGKLANHKLIGKPPQNYGECEIEIEKEGGAQ